MQQIIDHIKKQSPEKQSRFIWIAAGSVVIFLLIAWIIVGNHQKPKSETDLFQTLKKGIEDAKTNIANPQLK